MEETEIHLLLTMNPDGYEVAKEGECSPEENILGRLNANLIDLSRDFPDARKFEDADESRQPETLNVLKWVDSHSSFKLGITFFSGEVVASYPFFAVRLEVE